MNRDELIISRRVTLLQWSLPILIIVLVVLYQTFFVNYIHDILGENVHYIVEVVFYGAMGPLATFLVLTWIRRWLVDKEKMEQKVREQEKRLALIRVEEGKRVAQHLHREVLPNLAYVHTKMDHIQGNLLLPEPDPKPVAQEIVKVMGTLRETIGELRDKINTLRKGSLLKSLKAGSNIAVELQRRADEFQQLLHLDVKIAIKGVQRTLPHELESSIWHIIGEGLNNIALHAQAKQAEVQLDFSDPQQLLLNIVDDGKGFDVGARLTHPTGLGLAHMAEEVDQRGGTLRIDSTKGEGTRIFAVIPLLQGIDLS